jgi:hypothetical protein
MDTEHEETTVARKATKKAKGEAGSGRSKRHGTLIRVADDVASDAKLVAGFLNVSMAEYVSNTLRPIVKAELETQMRKRLAAADAEKTASVTDPESEVN